MKNLQLIVTIILGVSFSSNAQEKCSDGLSVKAELIGKGIPDYAGDDCKGDYYYSKIILQNNEDSVIEFYLFNCSWQFSWVIDNPSLYFWLPGCDGNWFDLIKLDAHKSITFYGVLKSKSDIKENNFKLGFVMLPFEKNKLFDPVMITTEYKKSRKVFWSNPLILADNTNTFTIDKDNSAQYSQ